MSRSLGLALVRLGLEDAECPHHFLRNGAREANLRSIVQAHGFARLRAVDGSALVVRLEVILPGVGHRTLYWLALRYPSRGGIG
ncbi:MAG: hypothetical protein EOO77_46095 [Oxalobacteraceae bacterium]|nr:MAG: hypothetical protein EOO77_46095 [Oxalobacteraceae bacterium]